MKIIDRLFTHYSSRAWFLDFSLKAWPEGDERKYPIRHAWLQLKLVCCAVASVFFHQLGGSYE